MLTYLLMNMKNKRRQFIKVVEKSRALNREEKRDLILVSDTLPKEYKNKVVKLLETFDEHSKARQEYLKEQLENAHAKLEDELVKDGVEEEQKNELLLRAREQIEKVVC